MQWLRRILIPVHRYLGIPLSFLFVLWFVSGIAMIYVGGMPQLSEEERLEHLPELDLAAVRLTPSEALARAELGAPGEVTLLPVLGRPAYRFGDRGGATTVFADTGEVLQAVDLEAEQTIAARFAGVPESAVRYVRTVERPDQWTLVMSRALPLEKFAVDDGRGTEVYVSSADAAVALVTTTRTRTLAWVATIPHWFYITPLRVNQPLWYWTVVSASGLGCVLAVLGLVLGVTQFRKSTPFSISASIRYHGLDALALHPRRVVRRLRAHLGVQRALVDGAVRLDERGRSRDARRRVHGRSARGRPFRCVRRRRVERASRRTHAQGDRAPANPGRALLRSALQRRTGRRRRETRAAASAVFDRAAARSPRRT